MRRCSSGSAPVFLFLLTLSAAAQTPAPHPVAAAAASSDPGRVSIPVSVTDLGVELRTEYILAFQPAPADRDGRWHKLKVRVSRPPGVPSLVVYAPEGYFAPTR